MRQQLMKFIAMACQNSTNITNLPIKSHPLLEKHIANTKTKSSDNPDLYELLAGIKKECRWDEEYIIVQLFLGKIINKQKIARVPPPREIILLLPFWWGEAPFKQCFTLWDRGTQNQSNINK